MVDDDRFEEVYRAHGPSVVRYCVYSTGSVAAAEDVAAETFARYLEKGERVSPDQVEAWLIKVAHNLCTSHHRSVARGRLLATKVAQQPEAHADGWIDPGAWEHVRALRPRERLVVYLRVYEEWPFGQISSLLRVSDSAVKMTYYRAVERLRERMLRDSSGRVNDLVGGATDVC